MRPAPVQALVIVLGGLQLAPCMCTPMTATEQHAEGHREDTAHVHVRRGRGRGHRAASVGRQADTSTRGSRWFGGQIIGRGGVDCCFQDVGLSDVATKQLQQGVVPHTDRLVVVLLQEHWGGQARGSRGNRATASPHGGGGRGRGGGEGSQTESTSDTRPAACGNPGSSAPDHPRRHMQRFLLLVLASPRAPQAAGAQLFDAPGPANPHSAGPWCANICARMPTCVDFVWSWPWRFCLLVTEAHDGRSRPLLHEVQDLFRGHGSVAACSETDPIVAASGFTFAAVGSGPAAADAQDTGSSGLGTCFPTVMAAVASTVHAGDGSAGQGTGAVDTPARRVVRDWPTLSHHDARAAAAVCGGGSGGDHGTCVADVGDEGAAESSLAVGDFAEHDGRIQRQELCAVATARELMCRHPEEVALAYSLSHLHAPLLASANGGCTGAATDRGAGCDSDAGRTGWARDGRFVLNPLLPATGRPAPWSVVQPVQLPEAAVVVNVSDALVHVRRFGLVFTRSRVFTLGKWYHASVHANDESDCPAPAQCRITPVVHALVNLITPWSKFYQHAVFDVLPRLALVLHILRDDPSARLLVAKSSAAVVDLIATFTGIAGIRARMLVAEPCTIYRAQRVYLPQLTGSNTKMGIVPPGILVAARRNLVEGRAWPDKDKQTTVLFLARPHGKRRGMSPDNQRALVAAIEGALHPRYRLRVFANGTDWTTDRGVFSTAVVVLGAHGGAHANMVFMPPESHVVEFLGGPTAADAVPYANDRPCYQGLAAACGLHYWSVAAADFHFTDKTLQMQVPVRDVLQILWRIGVARHGG